MNSNIQLNAKLAQVGGPRLHVADIYSMQDGEEYTDDIHLRRRALQELHYNFSVHVTETKQDTIFNNQIIFKL